MTTYTSLSFADLGGELTEPQALAWLGLLETHHAIYRQLDTLLRASHQLGLSSYEALARLARAPACRLRMSELAALSPLTLSGVSRMVDRLERDGLVKREVSAEDGRVACATLTSAGATLLQAAHQTYIAGVHRLFLDRLSEQDLEALGACWRRLGFHL